MLKQQNVYAIEYAEVENILLSEPILKEVAALLGFEREQAVERVGRVKTHIFSMAKQEVEKNCMEYTKRRMERALSTMGFKEKTIDELAKEFGERTKTLDPATIYENRRKEIEQIIESRDYHGLLAVYENKGAVKQIGGMYNLKANEYPDFVLRQIGCEGGKKLLETLRGLVPDLGDPSQVSA